MDTSAREDWTSRLTDEELVKAIQEGQKELWPIAIGRWQQRIFPFIYGKVHHYEIAKELTQETMKKVASGINSFRWEAKFNSWMFTIANNTVQTHLRRKTLPSEPLNEDTAQIARPDCVDRNLISSETCEQISKAIQQLPEPQRRAFSLVVVGGLTIREAAAIEECPEGTIGTRVNTAKHRLRELLSHMRETD